MANIKVIYQSRGGHTEAVAKQIAEECGTTAISINEPNTLGPADLLFIGMGVYAGHPDNGLMDYLDQLPVNTIRGAAIFSTSARGIDNTQLVVNLLEHKGITVYPNPCLLKGQFLFVSKGRPDKRDFRKAREYAREVMAAFNGE
ncbi:MAG: hypothetical protein IIY72_03835 [Solobacterium sp.]|nr:hypothetical protein [Solobacterium sp.]